MNNNILITSAGRRVSLIRFFKDELRKVFPEAKVLTTDANPAYASACMVSDGYFTVARVSAPNYIEQLLKIALDNNVRIIIPTIDTELLVLSKNIELFRLNKIHIVISDEDMVAVFRDKRRTHEFFERHGISTAREFTKDNYTLPLYLKPVDGSRSVDNFIIRNESELTEYHFANDKLMFLEYLDHNDFTEYTIDCYYDANSNLKCFIPRKRIEVRDGEVNKALTKRAAFIHDISKKIAYIKGFRGCITLQVFVSKHNNSVYGIEINPRFGGGFPLSYLAGGNFPKWIIEEYMLGKTVPPCNNWEENLLMLRYDDEVLVHNFKH